MPRTPARRPYKIFFTFIAALLSAFLYSADKRDFPLSKNKTPVQVAPAEIFRIARVVDGDTLVLSNGEKVRLTGIDTPESHINPKAKKDSERSGEDLQVITKKGQEAARFVRELAEGKEVRLEYDVQQRDRYGRLLVYAYDIETLKNNPQVKLPEGLVISANKEIFLNGSIIRSGYAAPMTVAPNVKYAPLFKQFYAEARGQKRGLWAQNP